MNIAMEIIEKKANKERLYTRLSLISEKCATYGKKSPKSRTIPYIALPYMTKTLDFLDFSHIWHQEVKISERWVYSLYFYPALSDS